MCGILGYFSDAPAAFDAAAALHALAHRGPDHAAHFAESIADKTVMMGHTRLSIIDLSEAGHQPMHHEGLSLVYNGEVYNYRELRDTFLNDATLHSGSDTEVLLRLYAKMGPKCLPLLNGDFAFALLDRKQERLSLVRDRLGVKPLYLYRAHGLLAWASELKAFKAAGLPLSLDKGEVGNFLIFKYSPGQRTLYREVSRLAPAHVLHIDLRNGEEELERYWSLDDALHDPWQGSYAEARELLRDTVGRAVQRRLVADVPISNYLSGGLDSSIIAHYLRGGSHTHYCAVKSDRDLRAEGTSSDGHYARVLARDWGLKLIEIPIGMNQLSAEHIARASWACCDPIADGSVIPAMLIAEQAAREHRVVLSGMGADELFLGYNGHMLMRLSTHADRLPGLKALVAPAMRRIAAGRGPFKAYRRYLQKWGNNLGKDFEPGRYSVVGDVDSARALFSGEERYTEVFAPYFAEADADPFAAMLRFELDHFLVKNLHYLDRSSMAYGLESRVPFLDHEVVELAARLPLHYKLDWKLRSKRILKDAYADVLPAYITRRRKAGFGMPLRSLLAQAATMYALLPEDKIEGLGCIDMDALRRVKEEHLSGQKDQSALIYALVVLGGVVD